MPYIPRAPLVLKDPPARTVPRDVREGTGHGTKASATSLAEAPRTSLVVTSFGWKQGRKTWGHFHVPGLGQSGTGRKRFFKLLPLQKAGGVDVRGLKLMAGSEKGSGRNGWKSGFFNSVKWVFPRTCVVRTGLDLGQCRWDPHCKMQWRFNSLLCQSVECQTTAERVASLGFLLRHTSLEKKKDRIYAYRPWEI